MTSDGRVVRVRLLDESYREKSGQMVTVARLGSGWAVRDVSYWVAD